MNKYADLLWSSGQRHRFASQKSLVRITAWAWMLVFVMVTETEIKTRDIPKNAECVHER